MEGLASMLRDMSVNQMDTGTHQKPAWKAPRAYKNGSIRRKPGQWTIHWDGHDVPVPDVNVEALRSQKTVQLFVSELDESALDWATVKALRDTPALVPHKMVGKRVGDSGVAPDHYAYLVRAHYLHPSLGIPTSRMAYPSSDREQSSRILDQERISTEVAGDGWAATVNDIFDDSTRKKAVIAPTRVLAGLRSLVNQRLGPVVDIPVELVPPQLRLTALRRSSGPASE